MRVEYINPFVAALANTFKTMLNCATRRGKLHLKTGKQPLYGVSGIIGLSGKAVGTVVVSMSESVAVKAASAMLMMEMSEVDDDVLDAVGEITNMVAGSAKAELEQYELSISLPNVISGGDHDIHFPANAKPFCVPFETDWGPLVLEVGLSEVAVPAGV